MSFRERGARRSLPGTWSDGASASLLSCGSGENRLHVAAAQAVDLLERSFEGGRREDAELKVLGELDLIGALVHLLEQLVGDLDGGDEGDDGGEKPQAEGSADAPDGE